MSNRDTVIVLATDAQGPIYLGELDPGIRQGVRRREHAVRFTSMGARRVANGYSGAIMERA